MPQALHPSNLFSGTFLPSWAISRIVPFATSAIARLPGKRVRFPHVQRVEIRPAKTADAGSILAIYNHEVQTSTNTLDLTPRTLDQQQQYLEDRAGAFAVLVAVDGTDVVGFGSLSPYRDRPGYRTSVEDSVYVARDCHGRGIGASLLAGLIDTATERGFHTVLARVVGPQVPSLKLHEAHGFTTIGIEREVARKFGRWHDVALLQRML